MLLNRAAEHLELALRTGGPLMAAGNIRPRCRVCGRPVKYFGDYCPDDEPGEDGPDPMTELTDADLRRLEERQSREDY